MEAALILRIMGEQETPTSLRFNGPGVQLLFRGQHLGRYANAGGDFMAQTVDLPEKVWSALQRAATASGLTPAGWIAAHLPPPADANGESAQVEEESGHP
jgi:hypothetical protein